MIKFRHCDETIVVAKFVNGRPIMRLQVHVQIVPV